MPPKRKFLSIKKSCFTEVWLKILIAFLVSRSKMRMNLLTCLLTLIVIQIPVIPILIWDLMIMPLQNHRDTDPTPLRKQKFSDLDKVLDLDNYDPPPPPQNKNMQILNIQMLLRHFKFNGKLSNKTITVIQGDSH